MSRVASLLRASLAGVVLAAFAFALIGPLANLALWSVAERWYTPYKLPVTYGTRYWEQVFRPTGDAMASLGTSVWIAVLTVVVALALSVPAGYALARLKLPMRSLFMIVFLLPQAFPSVAIYINVARIFYDSASTARYSASCWSTPPMAWSIRCGSRPRPSRRSTRISNSRPATSAPRRCAPSSR